MSSGMKDTTSFPPKGTLRDRPGTAEFKEAYGVPVGTALPADVFEKNKTLPKAFQPVTIRGLEVKNRIWVAPMCQYSSVDGATTDWHLVHIGGFATRGAGLICMEATSVTPEGRITPQDNGIWSDDHIPGLKRIVDFAHAQGTLIGIQLAHAGRKASTRAPWAQYDIKNKDKWAGKEGVGRSSTATVEEGGWPDDTLAPSAIPWDASYPIPKELTKEGIVCLLDAFEAATIRAKKAGFDFVELHGAHGYLMHEFNSPLSNKRTDEYGGSLENRNRFSVEVAERVRAAWGFDKPIMYRMSASDWAEGPEQGPNGDWLQWGIKQNIALAETLISSPKTSIDLFDVSSAGNWAAQKIAVKPGFQVPFAAELKKAVGDKALVSSVGLITEAKQVEDILNEDGLDGVFLARELLRDVDFPLKIAQELGAVVRPSVQYERAWTRMLH